jgi:hypothetical protein
MSRAAGGRVSGIAWQLRLKPRTEPLGGIQHGRLRLDGRQYGLCDRGSVPVPFGLINAGPHGVLYGYVAAGGGGYRITVSAGSRALARTATDSMFFIRALPRSACSYPVLTVTATSTPVAGMPPAISRSLDDSAPAFTTTMRFGDCRRHALVTPVSEHGQRRGRSPNAPLAHVRAQVPLTVPSRSQSRASGTIWELTHNAQRGVGLLAVRLRPGRYGIWLLTPHKRPVVLGTATITHDELRGAYDLPADTTTAHIVIATRPPGQSNTPGTVVLRATL